MADATIVALCKAVAERVEVKQDEFGKEYTVKRDYGTDFRKWKEPGMVIFVRPSTVEIAEATRDADEHRYEVQLGVLQKVKIADVEAIDDLIAFVEKVMDDFRVNNELDSLPDAVLTDVSNLPVIDYGNIQDGIFVSGIGLSYDLNR